MILQKSGATYNYQAGSSNNHFFENFDIFYLL